MSFTGGTGTYWYHHDRLGSVVEITDASGASVDRIDYKAFGQIRSEFGTISSPFEFAGEYLDPTGLYHLGARQYDPGTGRFLTTDPVAQEESDPYVASYLYARDRPTVLTDPSGRNPCAAVAAALAPAGVTGVGIGVDAGATLICLAIAGLLLEPVVQGIANNPPSISIDIANPQPGATPQPGPAPIPTYEPFPNAYDQAHPDLNPDLLGRQSPWRPCSSAPCRLGLIGIIGTLVWNAFTSQGKVPPFTEVPATNK